MDTEPNLPELRDSIKVDVETSFLPDQSDTEEGRFVFAYTITITNTGTISLNAQGRKLPRYISAAANPNDLG